MNSITIDFDNYLATDTVNVVIMSPKLRLLLLATQLLYICHSGTMGKFMFPNITGDEQMLRRLLVYNKDDCQATMVLKQALEKLPVKN